MGLRDSTTGDVQMMDIIISDAIEGLIFEQAILTRLGYEWRNVAPEVRIRQLGHLGVIAKVCSSFIIEFQLGYNRLRTQDLSLDHDLGDLVKPRRRGNPLSRKRKHLGFFGRMVKAGTSYRERVREHQLISPKVLSRLTRLPRIQQATRENLEMYFLRPRSFFRTVHNEAWFVHNVGKVVDAHLGLWYCVQGYMEATEENIKSFVEGISEVIRDEVAQLYWERVKAQPQYEKLLLLIYDDDKELVSAL